MTENIPGAPGGQSEHLPEPGQPSQTNPDAAAWSGRPGHGDIPDSPAESGSPANAAVNPSANQPSPPSGQPGHQPTTPSPWSSTGYQYYQSDQPTAQQSAAQQQTQPYGGYAQPGGSQTMTMSAGDQPRKSRAGLVAGVAVLALVVGGAAGSVGGYLFSGNGSGSYVNALTQPEPAKQASNAPAGSVQAVAQHVLPTVVEIAATFPPQNGADGDTGSGIVITSDGDILTNNHVVANAANGGSLQVVFSNGKTVNANIVGRDPTSDLAVIKAQGVSGLPTAQLGRSDDLQVGQNVVAIGAPYQLSGTVTSGIISALHRATAAGDGGQNSQETVMDAIQTDAPINPGNSGGPLVNMQGQVIGINSAIYSPSSGGGGLGGGQSEGGNVGIGFAIPIDQAKRTATELQKTGHATQTVLGVQVCDNIPGATNGQGLCNGQGGNAILTNGALIGQVTPGGPADKAGIKAGEVVVKADDRLITSANDLVAAVHAASPGDQMKLTFSNGGTATVTLDGKPVTTG